jgi:hypothetical protein
VLNAMLANAMAPTPEVRAANDVKRKKEYEQQKLEKSSRVPIKGRNGGPANKAVQ